MKTKAISIAFVNLFIALPVLAAEPSAPFTSVFQGPNLALGLVAVVQLIAILTVVSILRRLTRNTDYFVKLRKMRENATGKGGLLVAGFSILAAQVSAQSAEQSPFPAFFRDENTWMLLGLNVVLLLAFIYVTSLLRSTIAMLMPEAEAAPGTAADAAEAPSPIMAALTDAVPLEREHEILLDHEYDGIKELDNNLPPWWVWMFYVTIAMGVVYLVWYHVLPYGQSQHEQYIAELETAEKEKQAYIALLGETVDETNVAFLDGPDDLKAGKAIFTEHCQACHAADGGGGVGPNFTDNYWIHGGGIVDIFKTIKYGVPQKGMISWESQLRPKDMAQVASYIKTLVGTTPANPKEPQGDLYQEQTDAPKEETAAPADSVLTDDASKTAQLQ